jgi:hypothetical protein
MVPAINRNTELVRENEYVFKLPQGIGSRLTEFTEHMENNLEELCLTSVKVRVTNLDDIFAKLAKEEKAEHKQSTSLDELPKDWWNEDMPTY